MTDDRTHERVRWHCRRGLLELDLFLQKFLARDYAMLTEHEHAVFVRLLETPDPELLDYCLGHAQPNDPELAALVRKIADSR